MGWCRVESDKCEHRGSIKMLEDEGLSSERDTVRAPVCPGLPDDECPILVSLYHALDAATRPVAKKISEYTTEELRAELRRREHALHR